MRIATESTQRDSVTYTVHAEGDEHGTQVTQKGVLFLVGHEEGQSNEASASLCPLTVSHITLLSERLWEPFSGEQV